MFFGEDGVGEAILRIRLRKVLLTASSSNVLSVLNPERAFNERLPLCRLNPTLVTFHHACLEVLAEERVEFGSKCKN